MSRPFNLDAFVASYIEALYFTDTGEEGQPDTDAELAPETRQRIEDDCAAFLWRAYPYLDAIDNAHPGDERDISIDEPAYERAARDFHFTRNGHGVGFWEPGRWPAPYGDMLDKLARSFGQLDVYEGDDGLIYA